MNIEHFAKYEGFILVGIVMIFGTALKLFGKFDFSSDWFWLIAGWGLVIEGTISYVKQTKFDNKFKIITKE